MAHVIRTGHGVDVAGHEVGHGVGAGREVSVDGREVGAVGHI